jgi:hypothetical protein
VSEFYRSAEEMSSENYNGYPKIQLFRGGVLKKVVITLSFIGFAYAVFRGIALKQADQVTLVIFWISLVTIGGISFVESRRHSRELRAWMNRKEGRSRPPENNARDVT